MAQQHINLGTSPSDGTGDGLRTALGKVEANFTELYTAAAGAATSGDISTAVASEATARNTAISTAVASEATARNTAISTAVGTESTARSNADTTLQGNIDAAVANISRWEQYDIDGGGLYWTQVADIGNNVITDQNETNACWVFLPLFADAVAKRGVIRIQSARNYDGADAYIGIYPNPAEWSPNRMLVGVDTLFSAYTTGKGLIELMPVSINGTYYWQVTNLSGGPLQDRD